MTRKRAGNERLGASRADAGRARALRPSVGCSSSHIAGHQQRLPPDGAGRAQRAAADMHMSLRLGLTWGGGAGEGPRRRTYDGAQDTARWRCGEFRREATGLPDMASQPMTSWAGRAVRAGGRDA